MNARYAIKRILGLVPLFFGITLVCFAVIHLAPGGPIDASGAMNPKMTAQAREKMTELYGLDKPVLTQYILWCRRLAAFDLGRSFADGEDVAVKISRAIPVTLGINFLSLLAIFFLGIPAGIYGALHENSRSDRVLTFFTLAGFSVPAFWLSLILMSVFGVWLRWLPVSGLHSLFYEEMSWPARVWDTARHLALPVLVSAVTGMAGVARFMRSSFAGVLKENYIRTARAKGLPESRVLYSHALKNAMLPIITLIGLAIPGLLGGSVIFETIFSIPGMGRLFYGAVFARDYPVVMGILGLGSFLTLAGNLAADLAYRIADPRIREGAPQ